VFFAGDPRARMSRTDGLRVWLCDASPLPFPPFSACLLAAGLASTEHDICAGRRGRLEQPESEPAREPWGRAAGEG